MSRLYKKKGRGNGQNTANCTRAKGHMIKLKGYALWTNKRKSFFIQYTVNLPNSLPQGVIATNAVAGFQSGLDNFMTVIKIRGPASSDDGKGNQTPRCSLWDGRRRHGKEALPSVPPRTSSTGPYWELQLPLKRLVLPTSTAWAPSLTFSGATTPCFSVKTKHETLVWVSKHSPLAAGSSAGDTIPLAYFFHATE